MLGFGNEVVRDMTGKTPDTIEEQEAVAIHVARLVHGGEVCIEYAYDAESLKERIEHRASGAEVDYAIGKTCSAYGYEPSMFAFIRQKGCPNTVIVAEQPYEFAGAISEYLTGGNSELDTLFLSLPDAVRALQENQDIEVDFAGIDAVLEPELDVAGPEDSGPF